MKPFFVFAVILAFAVLDFALENPAPSATIPISHDRALQLGRAYAADFFAGKGASLWSKMNPEMQTALKSASDWQAFNSGALGQLGKETQVLSERVMPAMQLQVYERLFKTDAAPMNLVMVISIAPDERIGGFFVKPEGNPSPSKYLDYKAKSTFRLPFDGQWTVYQGGRSVFDNYHAAYPDERFAYDIVVLRDGRLYKGDGTQLADFFSFGQPILAPAAGKVVAAVDQYDDNAINKPGSPKEGNNIVIDHGNGEFSMMAHLKRGSVKVKAGDTVKAGQQIAECGNSGNSPFPHLHYHLQTTSTWFQGDGLPVAFTNVKVNGKHQDSAEPVGGDIVAAE